MICALCDEEFNEKSAEKKRIGGKINHCPDCAFERSPKALGFASGDGKMASISILKFESEKDARAYKEYWARASGLRKGKQCSLHQPGLTAPNVKMKIISTSQATNHKGKM